ncbi:MFS transporter [Paracoccus sp. Z330]|uniref:MFS transporter n=1 Tax=Paracoccus onchidii TaxID=3017813 RepID=A0ABT4ZA25_9RHOB|nr:MFS transporter [Paracoccus onchidii]MDB6176105.1 MFS transporter [Paracoccus onchidii]
MQITTQRVAVSALFFANGLMIGSWAPKLAVLIRRLGITEGTAGLVVLCLGLGSLVVMPVFGAMTARVGSRRAVWMASLLATPTLLLMTAAPGLVWVALAVFLFGGFLGGMDIAMNANAVVVERVQRRAIMSSCHGFWSLGGGVGAGLGGMILAAWGEAGHAVLVTLLFLAVLALALPRLQQDAPATDADKAPIKLPGTPLPYVLGVVALCCMVPEGAILDWGAVYLQRELGASLSLAGWGFAACAATMAVVRFLGDMLRNRFGAVSMMRFSALTGIAGLGVSGIAADPIVVILGFGLAGIGIANLMPIVVSAAGNLPGLAHGVGLSVVTMMGYSGILLAPGSIGFLAERHSFATIYLGLAFLLLIPLLFSRLVRSAGFEMSEADNCGEQAAASSLRDVA